MFKDILISFTSNYPLYNFNFYGYEYTITKATPFWHIRDAHKYQYINFLLKTLGNKSHIECKTRYHEINPWKDINVNLNIYVSRKISDFFLCILKCEVYRHLFYISKDKDAYPFSYYNFEVNYDEFKRTADYIMMKFFDPKNEKYLYKAYCPHYKYNNLSFLLFPFMYEFA